MSQTGALLCASYGLLTPGSLRKLTPCRNARAAVDLAKVLVGGRAVDGDAAGVGVVGQYGEDPVPQRSPRTGAGVLADVGVEEPTPPGGIHTEDGVGRGVPPGVPRPADPKSPMVSDLRLSIAGGDGTRFLPRSGLPSPSSCSSLLHD